MEVVAMLPAVPPSIFASSKTFHHESSRLKSHGRLTCSLKSVNVNLLEGRRALNGFPSLSLSPRKRSTLHSRKWSRFFVHRVSAGLSGNLLAGVATVALKSRLRAYDVVETQIDCSLRGLLQGYVKGVRIVGAGWQSPLELTCRDLEVTVTDVQLDVKALVSKQMITLLKPPIGRASIGFNSTDFANFLAHPLMVVASEVAFSGSPFRFLPSQGAEVKRQTSHPVSSTGHVVAFKGFLPSHNAGYSIEMGVDKDDPTKVIINARADVRSQRQMGSMAFVRASNSQLRDQPVEYEVAESANSKLVGGGTSAHGLQGSSGLDPMGDLVKIREDEIARSLESFFGNLMLELDGTKMKFAGMRFYQRERSDAAGAKEVVVGLDLDVQVRNFPPPRVSF
eukprot:TRINITY_DN38438_c0_g1_i1.p1 TRINITY_DN38438_c0_g1~~TRINITY_DN38438_c0_g1_i1.p1  ORF type:complete len:394 (-),score=48.74 TRINITY_DN38438_c0_g1_i1:297-1478(-)